MTSRGLEPFDSSYLDYAAPPDSGRDFAPARSAGQACGLPLRGQEKPKIGAEADDE